MSRLLPLLVVSLLLSGSSPGADMASQPVEIHPWVTERLAGDGRADVMVVLRETADLSGAAELPTKDEKGWYVVDALREVARRSQAPLRRLLERRGLAYRSFYIVNAIQLTADRALVDELAARPEVLRVVGNPEFRVDLPRVDKALDHDLDETRQPNAVEWGVTKIKAPEVWALGYDGTGVVVGAQDTGYRWTHTSVKAQYRGWNGSTADHDYNWHDAIHGAAGGNPCGTDSPEPCDDHGHGTHTIGTVLGESGSNQIGVAPGAQWIGCRNMKSGAGTPARYLECFEFFLAPYPVGGDPVNDGDPSRAPDVTNNSWGCPPAEGCSWDEFVSAVAAQRAAGIMTVVSAGNEGPSCGTVGMPPAIYNDVYSVGSITSSESMSSFSSRGPSTDTNLVKPDIVAPGSGIRSAASSTDTSYTSMSGTSMAGPHVAGAVALFWSARPSLKNDVAATEAILDGSARRLTSIVEACGGDYVNGPNNTWGHGLIDVEQAVLQAEPRAQYRAASARQVADCGDDDGFPDNSETITVELTLDNVGLGDLTDVEVASVMSTDPGVSAITLPAPVAALAQGASTTVTFSYQLSGATFGKVIPFDVAVTAAEMSETVSASFSFLAEQDLAVGDVTWDFETDLDGWSVLQGTFSRTDAYSGSGGSNWALASSDNLDGQCDQVRSPLLVPTAAATLELATHYEIEEYSGQWWDRANLAVVVDGSSARTVLSPATGRAYNASGSGGSCGMGSDVGWADRSFQSWAGSAGFDLSPWIGQAVRLDVFYGTDGAVTGNGFRFDQVRLTGVERLVADAQPDSGLCATPPGPAAGNGASGALRAGRGTSGRIDFGFARSCNASGHAVYYQLLSGAAPTAAGWTSAGCAFDDPDDQGATFDSFFDPPDPAPGEVIGFVVVGHDDSSEGSYGTDSDGTERISAASSCDGLPRVLGGSCG